MPGATSRLYADKAPGYKGSVMAKGDLPPMDDHMPMYVDDYFEPQGIGIAHLCDWNEQQKLYICGTCSAKFPTLGEALNHENEFHAV